MKTKKLYLEILAQVLKGTEGKLNLADARIRDTFMKSLLEQADIYINQKQTIYKTFCSKNEQGEPDLLDGNKYQFPTDKLEEINKELLILSEEEVELPTNDKIKEFVEISEYKPKIGEVDLIDDLMKLF